MLFPLDTSPRNFSIQNDGGSNEGEEEIRVDIGARSLVIRTIERVKRK